VLTVTPRMGLPRPADLLLNDAFDAEEFGRIAGAMRALLARHDEKESFIRWRKRGEPAIKIPSK
jgi:hypothetical protein